MSGYPGRDGEHPTIVSLDYMDFSVRCTPDRANIILRNLRDAEQLARERGCKTFEVRNQPGQESDRVIWGMVR